jgi:hypothetical protein
MAEMNLLRCKCGSPLFLSWGLEVLSARDYPTPAGLNERGKDYGQAWDVRICAMCDTPYGLWDGCLHDLSEVIDQEMVRSVLLRLERAPKPAQARAMDP